MDGAEKIQMRRASYELFILFVTFLSWFNVLLIFFSATSNIVILARQINLLLSFTFLADFLIRLRIAPVRREYLIKQFGWLDLVSSIPIPGASFARVVHVLQVIGRLRRQGSRSLLRMIVANRANTALIFISLFVILILEFGSIFILQAEATAPDANITTAQDALWWVMVTISTVGYGDYYPVTQYGRFVAIFVIVAGVAVFGTLSGFLANSFLGQKSETDASTRTTAAENLLAELQQVRQSQAEDRTHFDETSEALAAQIEVLQALLKENMGRR